LCKKKDRGRRRKEEEEEGEEEEGREIKGPISELLVRAAHCMAG
jgi:hypothetical protein